VVGRGIIAHVFEVQLQIWLGTEYSGSAQKATASEQTQARPGFRPPTPEVVIPKEAKRGMETDGRLD
jgi:hypothetical protein